MATERLQTRASDFCAISERAGLADFGIEPVDRAYNHFETFGWAALLQRSRNCNGLHQIGTSGSVHRRRALRPNAFTLSFMVLSTWVCSVLSMPR